MEFGRPRVLVLDANQRSSLAVTRSLGRSTQYDVSTADSLPAALAGASRFSQSYLRYPAPDSQPERFTQWVSELVVNKKFDLFLPTTEVTSQLLLKLKETLPELDIPFGSFGTVMQLTNKQALIDLASSLDIAVPESTAYSNLRSVDAGLLKFPLVIKPTLSHFFHQERWVHTKVQIVRNLFDWEMAINQAPYLEYSPFMIQEFIPGHGSGIFCLYDQGKPLQFFAHQRLREKPPEGGVSVLSRSISVPEHLKASAERLLNAVSWHGVAMVEFRISNDGKPFLMEVNTRFWGSLQLAIDAGVDFPLMLVNSHLNKGTVETASYRVDQRLRWLLGDFDSLYIFLKSRTSLRKKLNRLLMFLSFRIKGQKHEINRLHDIGPAWIELKQYFHLNLSKTLKK